MLAYSPPPRLEIEQYLLPCCGLAPAVNVWQCDGKADVQVRCQNSACDNARGVEAPVGEILDKWEAVRKAEPVC